MTFTERLKQLRLDNGYTQIQLSDKLGIIFQWYQKWEWGKMRPNPKNMQRLADVFGVSVGYLKGETDDPELTATEKIEHLLPKLTDKQENELIQHIEKTYGVTCEIAS